MPRLLSRFATPTVLLYAFLIVAQFASGLYAALHVSLPPAFAIPYPLVFLWVVGWWMRSDSSARGVRWVFDMGLFLFIAWPFVLPYYLFKTRGAGALLAIVLFVGVYGTAYVLGVVAGVVMSS